jgi:excisionase family DNA binding protein
MTFQEAADYLRISLATIDRMVRANELSSVLIRGRRLFRTVTWTSISAPTAFPAANKAAHRHYLREVSDVCRHFYCHRESDHKQLTDFYLAKLAAIHGANLRHLILGFTPLTHFSGSNSCFSR